MNIKKIIREAVDDLEWIRDTEDRRVTIDNAHEGMKVQITDDSEFYEQGVKEEPPYTTKKMVGTITAVYSEGDRKSGYEHLADVIWENGEGFYYSIGPYEYDLEIYSL